MSSPVPWSSSTWRTTSSSPARGTWNSEIVQGVAPQPGDVVIGKQTHSPFLTPAFEQELKRRGIARLYVVDEIIAEWSRVPEPAAV